MARHSATSDLSSSLLSVWGVIPFFAALGCSAGDDPSVRLSVDHEDLKSDLLAFACTRRGRDRQCTG